MVGIWRLPLEVLCMIWHYCDEEAQKFYKLLLSWRDIVEYGEYVNDTFLFAKTVRAFQLCFDLLARNKKRFWLCFDLLATQTELKSKNKIVTERDVSFEMVEDGGDFPSDSKIRVLHSRNKPNQLRRLKSENKIVTDVSFEMVEDGVDFPSDSKISVLHSRNKPNQLRRINDFRTAKPHSTRGKPLTRPRRSNNHKKNTHAKIGRDYQSSVIALAELERKFDVTYWDDPDCSPDSDDDQYDPYRSSDSDDDQYDPYCSADSDDDQYDPYCSADSDDDPGYGDDPD
jgi:hypothetical protein